MESKSRQIVTEPVSGSTGSSPGSESSQPRAQPLQTSVVSSATTVNPKFVVSPAARCRRLAQHTPATSRRMRRSCMDKLVVPGARSSTVPQYRPSPSPSVSSRPRPSRHRLSATRSRSRPRSCRSHPGTASRQVRQIVTAPVAARAHRYHRPAPVVAPRCSAVADFRRLIATTGPEVGCPFDRAGSVVRSEHPSQTSHRPRPCQREQTVVPGPDPRLTAVQTVAITVGELNTPTGPAPSPVSDQGRSRPRS